MHAGFVAIGHVDEAAIVHFDVVRLDGDLAALRSAIYTARFRVRVRRRNEITDLLERVGIAHVERAHARVEPAHENDALVVSGNHVLVGAVRTEARAPRTEVTKLFGNPESTDADRLSFVRD